MGLARKKSEENLLFAVFSRSISLPSVFEPIGNLNFETQKIERFVSFDGFSCYLCCGEAGCFCQFPFLPWRRVRIMRVPITQNRSGFLLETVAGLLAVPLRITKAIIYNRKEFVSNNGRNINPLTRLFSAAETSVEPDTFPPRPTVFLATFRLPRNELQR